jgi:hypothetical protein
MLAVVFFVAEPLAGGNEAAIKVAPRPARLVQAAVVLLMLIAAPLLMIRGAHIQIGHPRMPEREAAAFVERTGLRGRVLVWFDWGEYVIWHFSPQLRVSIDGRRETIYSNALVDRHMQFYLGARDALTLPRDIDADYIWVPDWIPVVRELPREGWTPIFEGPASVIFARASAGIPDTVITTSVASDAFPGP